MDADPVLALVSDRLHVFLRVAAFEGQPDVPPRRRGRRVRGRAQDARARALARAPATARLRALLRSRHLHVNLCAAAALSALVRDQARAGPGRALVPVDAAALIFEGCTELADWRVTRRRKGGRLRARARARRGCKAEASRARALPPALLRARARSQVHGLPARERAGRGRAALQAQADAPRQRRAAAARALRARGVGELGRRVPRARARGAAAARRRGRRAAPPPRAKPATSRAARGSTRCGARGLGGRAQRRVRRRRGRGRARARGGLRRRDRRAARPRRPRPARGVPAPRRASSSLEAREHAACALAYLARPSTAPSRALVLAGGLARCLSLLEEELGSVSLAARRRGRRDAPRISGESAGARARARAHFSSPRGSERESVSAPRARFRRSLGDGTRPERRTCLRPSLTPGGALARAFSSSRVPFRPKEDAPELTPPALAAARSGGARARRAADDDDDADDADDADDDVDGDGYDDGGASARAGDDGALAGQSGVAADGAEGGGAVSRATLERLVHLLAHVSHLQRSGAVLLYACAAVWALARDAARRRALGESRRAVSKPLSLGDEAQAHPSSRAPLSSPPLFRASQASCARSTRSATCLRSARRRACRSSRRARCGCSRATSATRARACLHGGAAAFAGLALLPAERGCRARRAARRGRPARARRALRRPAAGRRASRSARRAARRVRRRRARARPRAAPAAAARRATTRARRT